MSYNIWIESALEAPKFGQQLTELVDRSRFHIGSWDFTLGKEPRRQPGRQCKRHGFVWRLKLIRLRQPKDYCGQHAFSCAVANPGRRQKHRHYSYLEGADWVAFNDMINDVLDDLNLSAEVWSNARNRDNGINVRHGYLRCVEYLASAEQGGDWLKEGHFKDRRNKKRRRAKYPRGTPGNPRYLAEPILEAV